MKLQATELGPVDVANCVENCDAFHQPGLAGGDQLLDAIEVSCSAKALHVVGVGWDISEENKSHETLEVGRADVFLFIEISRSLEDFLHSGAETSDAFLVDFERFSSNVEGEVWSGQSPYFDFCCDSGSF